MRLRPGLLSVVEVGFLLLGLLIMLAQGASSSEKTAVSWSVQPFAVLSIKGSASDESESSISLPFHLPQPTAEDLERGYIEVPSALTLLARSNTSWQLFVHAKERELGRSYDGLYVKPISDFQLRARLRLQGQEGSEPGDHLYLYLTISNEDQLLIQGERGEWEIKLDYRILLHRERYRPGDYRITLIYTITPE